ncbi:uncharacterized protein LOC123821495 [Phyllostomus hastatus]|uniref:uncharacterized protein LOC123821495 n=1 Tax=Phyllostomus hastatus TaxID=9423 RepID=UPI001E683808|nr:uncharacterized protein LOC123821495 [Phyllostomus hastatus]
MIQTYIVFWKKFDEMAAPVGRDHWRLLEAGGGAGSPGVLTESARLRSWALGAGRRTPGRSWACGRADGRGRRTGGSRLGKSLEGGVWCGGCYLAGSPVGSPSFPLALAAGSQHLSTLAPPLPSSFGWAGLCWWGTRDRRGEPISCQAGDGATDGGGRHTKNAVSGGSERGRQFRDSNSRPHPLVPPPLRLGPRPWRQCGRAESVGPYLMVPRFAQPPPWWPGSRPGKGRPLVLAAGVGSRSAAAEPDNLRAGKSLRPLRGVARPAPGIRGHRR